MCKVPSSWGASYTIRENGLVRRRFVDNFFFFSILNTNKEKQNVCPPNEII